MSSVAEGGVMEGLRSAGRVRPVPNMRAFVKNLMVTHCGYQVRYQGIKYHMGLVTAVKNQEHK